MNNLSKGLDFINCRANCYFGILETAAVDGNEFITMTKTTKKK
jgi:hypothetical protein